MKTTKSPAGLYEAATGSHLTERGRKLANSIAALAGVAALVGTLKGGTAIAAGAKQNLHEAYDVPSTVAADSLHRDIVFGQEYNVGTKKVVVKDLSSVAEVAAVPGVSQANELIMLENEFESRGIDIGSIEPGTVAYVQDSAKNGAEYKPE